jgi:hypothetical protein
MKPIFKDAGNAESGMSKVVKSSELPTPQILGAHLVEY